MKKRVFETAFDTYTSTRFVGQGGSGSVFAVKNNGDQEFALKLVSSGGLNTEKLKRFKNEIEFCKKSNHKNIVRVLDCGFIAGDEIKMPFYVMPIYQSSLRQAIPAIRNGTQQLRVYSEMLDAVEAAHIRSVWHRDIKPENFLCSSDGSNLVLADFGIAHFEESELHTVVETKVASRLANFQYAAPEQRKRKSTVDLRCDIYAMGLLLNEIFTGEIPQGTGFKRIAESNPEYGYLDELVDDMINQNPANRPQDIRSIKESLIARKNSFIALQELDSKSNIIITDTEIPEFEHVVLQGVDYENGSLKLQLNRSVPREWVQEFQNPRGGHSSVMGHGPETFNFSNNISTTGVQADKRLIQRLVDHFKDYLVAANSSYIYRLERDRAEVRRQKETALEAELQAARTRADITSNIKF